MKRLICFLALFLGVRLLFFTSLPIFNDESMYLRWAVMFARDPSLWFLSLIIDGKQPALPVILGLITQIPGNSLIIARLFNVSVSLITLISVYSVMNLGFKGKGLFSALLLLTFCPYVLQYDRMAMMETPVMAAHVATLALLLLYRSRGQLRFVIWAGIVSALGWWFKTTSLLTLVSGAVALVFQSQKLFDVRKLKAIALYLGSFYVVTVPLRLHPSFDAIGVRELERALSFKDFFSFPYLLWFANFGKALSFLTAFLTLPVLIVSFAGLIRGAAKSRAGIVILVFAFVPLVLEIMVSKIFTARYLVLVAPVFVVGAGYLFSLIKSWKKTAIFLGTVVLPVVFSFILIVNPVRYYHLLGFIPQAREDFGQYIRGWSAGFGIKEAVSLIKEEAKINPVTVFVRADSGNPEDAVIALLSKETAVSVYYVNEINTIVPKMLAKNPETIFLFISRGGQLAGLEAILKEVTRFGNPFGSADYVGVYRIVIPGKKDLSVLDGQHFFPYNTKAMSG